MITPVHLLTLSCGKYFLRQSMTDVSVNFFAFCTIISDWLMRRSSSCPIYYPYPGTYYTALATFQMMDLCGVRRIDASIQNGVERSSSHAVRKSSMTEAEFLFAYSPLGSSPCWGTNDDALDSLGKGQPQFFRGPGTWTNGAIFSPGQRFAVRPFKTVDRRLLHR